MSDIIVCKSVRTETSASTSPTASGTTVPVTAGTIVRTVELMLAAMDSRAVWTVGTTESTTADPVTVARWMLEMAICVG